MFWALLVCGIAALVLSYCVFRVTDNGCWVGYFVGGILLVLGFILLYGAWRVNANATHPVSIVIHTPRK